MRALLRSNRMAATMRLGSARSLASLWNGATRGRSILKIQATRQVIRGPRARVYLKLSLRDGTIVKDSEPLVPSWQVASRLAGCPTTGTWTPPVK